MVRHRVVSENEEWRNTNRASLKIAAGILAVLVSLLATDNYARQVAVQPDRTISNNDMKLVNFEGLTYPTVGRTARIQGVVVVRAGLDDQGQAVETSAISGPGPLIPDCLANAKKWRFQPNAEKAAVIVYHFRLTDAISKSGCSHFMLEPPNFATITSCVPEIQ